MNYANHYSALMQRARSRVIAGRVESHHVVPRCLGGSDGRKNRVALTPSEHYVAHQLLVKMFPDVPGLVLAAVSMARDNRNGKRSNNKLYAWLRQRASEATSIRQAGKPRSLETRGRISAGLKASPAMAAFTESRRGVPRADETNRKCSVAAKTSEAAKSARAQMNARKVGVPRSAETRAKLSAAGKRRVMSPEQRAKISVSLTGRAKSPEHIAKVSVALVGKLGTRLGAVASEETKQRMRHAALAVHAAKRSSLMIARST